LESSGRDDDGKQVVKGNTGTDGAAGRDGSNGNAGAAGAMIATSATAHKIWISGGSTRSQTDFVSSL
jgi:hypothetical protein